MELVATACPCCGGRELKRHSLYQTRHHGERTIHKCKTCGKRFSPTANIFLAGIRKPFSVIIYVIKARTEGQGLNAVCRIFCLAKNTVLTRERRFLAIKQILMLYTLLHQYLQLVIERDEVYTRVGKNTPPEESLGWTVVDRASRFLWELQCGRKDRKLFRKALRSLAKLVALTQDLSLITDGERRYGNVLYETPCPEHPESVQDLKNSDIHANHCEAFNSSPFGAATQLFAGRPTRMRKTSRLSREPWMSIG